MNYIDLLKEKYNTLEKREQSILMVGGLIVILFLLYSLIFKPMGDAIERLDKNNASKQELLVWMTQSAANLKGSSANGGKVDKRRGRSLNVIINTTSSSAKIAISRSQPRDNNQYQIWLENVVFNDLLRWLDVLQKDYGIYVNNINLGTTDNSGKVRVNLTFQDSGS